MNHLAPVTLSAARTAPTPGMARFCAITLQDNAALPMNEPKTADTSAHF
jgi:hypothetical protein